MKLEIQSTGNPQFPRFLIANDNGEVWDGTAWTLNRDKAILFTEGQTVARQFRELEEAQAAHLPLHEFGVTLNIRVRSPRPVSQEELANYLEKTVSILIDRSKGDGEFDGVVQMDVTWKEMKEKVVKR